MNCFRIGPVISESFGVGECRLTSFVHLKFRRTLYWWCIWSFVDSRLTVRQASFRNETKGCMDLWVYPRNYILNQRIEAATAVSSGRKEKQSGKRRRIKEKNIIAEVNSGKCAALVAQWRGGALVIHQKGCSEDDPELKSVVGGVIISDKDRKFLPLFRDRPLTCAIVRQSRSKSDIFEVLEDGTNYMVHYILYILWSKFILASWVIVRLKTLIAKRLIPKNRKRRYLTKLSATSQNAWNDPEYRICPEPKKPHSDRCHLNFYRTSWTTFVLDLRLGDVYGIELKSGILGCMNRWIWFVVIWEQSGADNWTAFRISNASHVAFSF